MAFFDMPLEKLRTYVPTHPEPTDFDAFWQQTLTENAQWMPDAQYERYDGDLYDLVDVYDVSFRGYGGQRVYGWFIEPAGNDKPLPCMVTYIGYGGGRATPIDHIAPVVAGFANFVMDTRGQGSAWGDGKTPDDFGTCNHYPGFMTKGIESRETYYYRRVFVDAVHAIRAAGEHPHVDESRICANGISQGGGIAIAASALAAEKVKLAIANVPFLCDIRRAITLVDSMPYREIALYLKTHRDKVSRVYETLAYFDGVHFSPRITASCLFSTGLMDTLCPPSTVFGAYNKIQSPKDIEVYEFNEHDGGAQFQQIKQLKYARERLM